MWSGTREWFGQSGLDFQEFQSDFAKEIIILRLEWGWKIFFQSGYMFDKLVPAIGRRTQFSPLWASTKLLSVHKDVMRGFPTSSHPRDQGGNSSAFVA